MNHVYVHEEVCHICSAVEFHWHHNYTIIAKIIVGFMQLACNTGIEW